MKHYNEQDFNHKSKASKEIFAGIFEFVFTQINDYFDINNIDKIYNKDEGIYIEWHNDIWRRSCHVDTEKYNVTILWDIIFNGISMDAK